MAALAFAHEDQTVGVGDDGGNAHFGLEVGHVVNVFDL